MMYNNIKCTSAPIEIKESKDSGIIKELDNMVPNHPREIIEFNKSANPSFISPFLVNELLDFKTRNAMSIDALKNNPTMDIVINEYIIFYRKSLRLQLNKLTRDNIDNTVSFIINNTNNILGNNEITEFIIQRVKNDMWVLTETFISVYGLLIAILTNEYHYHFDFRFNNEFLNYYFESDDIEGSLFLKVINNINHLIIILYKNNIITLDKIYEYFDSFLLNPVIPNNVEPITFYKSIISTIHGLPEGDRDFEPSILYDIFREYVQDKQNKGFNIVDIYREFIIEHDDSFLGRMLIEILDDISNNRNYCTLCRKEHIKAQK